jgi:uncharacterized protein (DUF1778 family)
MAKKKVSKNWISQTGRRPIQCGFLPEDYETIRKAAFYADSSMTGFAHDAVLEAARKIVEKREGK